MEAKLPIGAGSRVHDDVDQPVENGAPARQNVALGGA